MSEQNIKETLSDLQAYILKMHEAYLTVDASDLPKLLAMYRALDEIHDIVTDMGKQLGSIKTTQQYQVLPQQFDKLKVDSLRTSGRNFILSRRFSASVTNRDLGYTWLRDREYGAVIQETVHAQTLSSLIREHIETKAEEPNEKEDGIKTSKTLYVQMRKT